MVGKLAKKPDAQDREREKTDAGTERYDDDSEMVLSEVRNSYVRPFSLTRPHQQQAHEEEELRDTFLDLSSIMFYVCRLFSLLDTFIPSHHHHRHVAP